MNEEQSAAFSQKLQEIAKAPKYRGAIFQIEADEKGLALVDVKEASLKVYLMIDPEVDKILYLWRPHLYRPRRFLLS